MTRLTASPTAKQALAKKTLENRLAVVRGRVEALPQLHLGGLLDGAENKLRLLRLNDCADMLDQIDEKVQAHRDAIAQAEVAAAGQRLDQHLAEAQGIETVTVGSVRTRDGWHWLKTRPGRLTSEQADAGDRYGVLYRGAHRDTLSTSANDNVGGGETDFGPIDAQIRARDELLKIQAHIFTATGNDRLIQLLDSVCGKGDTLRVLSGKDDRKAGAYEAELKIALDMASVAMKGAGKREQAA